MDQRKNWLYLAYGSNLNRKQMELRCPTAKIVGTSALNHWRLIFRGGEQMAVATVERERGCKVPVLVWKLTPADERALDRYEGYPHLCRRKAGDRHDLPDESIYPPLWYALESVF